MSHLRVNEGPPRCRGLVLVHHTPWHRSAASTVCFKKQSKRSPRSSPRAGRLSETCVCRRLGFHVSKDITPKCELKTCRKWKPCFLPVATNDQSRFWVKHMNVEHPSALRKGCKCQEHHYGGSGFSGFSLCDKLVQLWSLYWTQSDSRWPDMHSHRCSPISELPLSKS